MDRLTIPIVDDSKTCAGLAELRVLPPRLTGDVARAATLLEPLHARVLPVLEPPGPVGSWLRSFRLADGEAELSVARELGCRTVLVSTEAFAALRNLLHDTDIYVRTEDHAAVG